MEEKSYSVFVDCKQVTEEYTKHRHYHDLKDIQVNESGVLVLVGGNGTTFINSDMWLSVDIYENED